MKTPEIGRGTASVVLLAVAAFLCVSVLALRYPDAVLRIVWIGMVAATALILFFSRDPDRKTCCGKTDLVSPSDGIVLSVERGVAWESGKDRGSLVSIFLSLWDVHVIRAPVAGTVKILEHHPGRFWPSFLRRASAVNEHLIIGIRTFEEMVYVKLVAGLFARRIVCKLSLGQKMETGQRIGRIHFGSRVELFVPDSVHLRLQKGTRVRAGETVLGSWPDV